MTLPTQQSQLWSSVAVSNAAIHWKGGRYMVSQYIKWVMCTFLKKEGGYVSGVLCQYFIVSALVCSERCPFQWVITSVITAKIAELVV